MLTKIPPVTVIRIPSSAGSFGYGAKLDGDILCIPMNPSVINALENSPIPIAKITVSTMSRNEFNELPDYIS